MTKAPAPSITPKFGRHQHFPPLAQNGSNYLEWAEDCRWFLEEEQTARCINFDETVLAPAVVPIIPATDPSRPSTWSSTRSQARTPATEENADQPQQQQGKEQDDDDDQLCPTKSVCTKCINLIRTHLFAGLKYAFSQYKDPNTL